MACKVADPYACHYFGCVLAQDGYCDRMRKIQNARANEKTGETRKGNH